MKQFRIYSERGDFPFQTNVALDPIINTDTEFLGIEAVKQKEVRSGKKNDTFRRTRFNGISNNGHYLSVITDMLPSYRIRYKNDKKKQKMITLFVDTEASAPELNICAGFYKYCNDNNYLLVGKDLVDVFNAFIVEVNKTRGDKPAFMLLEKGETEIV